MTEVEKVKEIEKRPTREEWKALTRGIPAYKVARVMNRCSPGVDWTGSNKRDMMETFLGTGIAADRMNRQRFRELIALEERDTPGKRAARKLERQRERMTAVLVNRTSYEGKRMLETIKEAEPVVRQRALEQLQQRVGLAEVHLEKAKDRLTHAQEQLALFERTLHNIVGDKGGEPE